MPAPLIYDLSYRTNTAGLFIPSEYISNFVAGERLVLDRVIRNMPFPLNTISMIVKPSEGSQNVLARKNISENTNTSDGYFTQDPTFTATATLDFREDETALMDQRRYFVIEANWTGGNGSMVMSSGYIQGTQPQSATSGLPGHIVIENLPGSMSTGTLQVVAHIEDNFGNVVTGFKLLFFSSDSAGCPVGDTGLVVAVTPGTYVITVASTEGNIASRATLTVVQT